MITLDLKSREPIYEQIVERFQIMIVSGILEADSQLPSVRTLAMELAINPNTIQKAYAQLEVEGYIYPVRGKGNFVSGNEELKRKKQEGIYRALENLVAKGRTLEIGRDDFIQKIKEYYEKERGEEK